MRRRSPPSPPAVVTVPEGYTLVRTAVRSAVLREAEMAVRLASLVAQSQERALVAGLLPTLRQGLSDTLRAMERSRPARDPLPPPAAGDAEG